MGDRVADPASLPGAPRAEEERASRGPDTLRLFRVAPWAPGPCAQTRARGSFVSLALPLRRPSVIWALPGR